MPKTRDISIDILKSIGMIAVVGSHCCFLPVFMGVFHNPVFMFAAGLLHSDNCCGSLYDYGTFLLKRLRKVYFPFVIITLFLTLFQPLLAFAHLDCNPPYSLAEMLGKILSAFAMRVEYLNAPSWFLISYLEVSLFFELLLMLTRKWNRKVWVTGFLFFSWGGYYLGFHLNLPRCLDESLVLLWWYLLGFLMKKVYGRIRLKGVRENDKLHWGYFLTSVGGFISLALAVSCWSIFANTKLSWHDGNPFVSCVLGSWAIICCCLAAKVFSSIRMAPVLSLPGKDSFSIMMWHFLGFRLLGMTMMSMGWLTAEQVLGYIPSLPNLWWSLAFCLIGIVFPMYLKRGYHYLINYFLNIGQNLKQGLH